MPLPDGFRTIDFDTYHRVELPALLATGRAAHVARATAGLPTLAVCVSDGRAYTYRPRTGGIDIVAGEAEASTVLEINVEAWQGLVHELEAPAGLLYAGRVRCVRGNAVDFMAWESALRALYNGRPPYDPDRVELADRAGMRLDINRTFSRANDRGDMADFLRVAGYLFVRAVFSAGEAERFLAEAEELRHEARPGDKLSWWGKNAAGDTVLCRVTRGNAKPSLAALRSDARVLALKDLADAQFVYKRGEGEGAAVIYKQPDMIEGLGDLPWHRDCGMGGHAVMCPTLVVSVYLTEASPENGELTMLPGSKDAAFNAHDPNQRGALRSAHFHARPGDVSLHYSDTVHAAPPPTARGRTRYRVSAVLTFARPDARHHRGRQSYNDVLHQRADGQVEHLVDVAKRL